MMGFCCPRKRILSSRESNRDSNAKEKAFKCFYYVKIISSCSPKCARQVFVIEIKKYRASTDVTSSMQPPCDSSRIAEFRAQNLNSLSSEQHTMNSAEQRKKKKKKGEELAKKERKILLLPFYRLSSIFRLF